MTFDQLQYFTAIYDCRNFSKAAELLFISQSSLSKQIKSLEHEIGCVLFERNTRGLKETPAAIELYSYADRILKEYELMQEKLSRYDRDGSLGNILKLGSIPVLNYYGLTDIISSFQDHYKNARIVLMEKDSSNIINDIESKSVDIAFIRANNIPSKNYHVYPLVQDEVVLVTNQHHPLAKYDCISLLEAKDEHFLFLGKHTGTYELCRSICENAGFTPDEQSYDMRSITLKSFVASGHGVSLMMRQSIKSMDDPKIKMIALKEHPTVILAMITRREKMNDLQNTFIEYTCDSFGQSPYGCQS